MATLCLDEADVIGGGSFGLVVGGEMNNQPVAVKLTVKEFRSIFEREHAALVKVAAHPHIYCVLGQEEFEDGRFALVLQRLQSYDLFQFFEINGPFDESTTRGLILPIVDAVAYCHQKDVTHCDIKLENVGFDMQHQPMLMDFGAANSSRSGSPPYAAPEALRADDLSESKYFSARDVWSLGVCVFALVQGFFPFCIAHTKDWRFRRVFERDDDDIKEQTVTARVGGLYRAAVPKLSASLQGMIDRMLVLRAKERASASQILEHEWMTSLDGT